MGDLGHIFMLAEIALLFFWRDLYCHSVHEYIVVFLYGSCSRLSESIADEDLQNLA